MLVVLKRVLVVLRGMGDVGNSGVMDSDGGDDSDGLSGCDMHE